MGKNIGIIFAGGSGVRMGAGIPKQFLEVNGKPIIIHTLDIFEDHNDIDEIYIACKAEYINKLKKMLDRYWIKKVAEIVPGGETGQDSILNALKAAKKNSGKDDIVLIHDGVRPCITEDIITNAIALVKDKGSAITCTELFETPVVSHNGEIVEDVPKRDNFYTAQAPQCFYIDDILEAHSKIREINPRYEGIVDSCTLMRSIGNEVAILLGNRGNIKVTTPEDLYVFRAMINYRETQDAFGFNANEMPEKRRRNK
ncbi:putative 2-C-methyl-D-erythritol 4-phosphate cytidylyltransferase [Eubacterium brachy ATCC 33089]|jgi:2-C-methyl-D-erythritol 4-phosphate cytidylyltransferase 2|nr:putative 2-C-methyl-D-erythritol 4-phosphate cytidylyltransferase [Eubacterium brachy ATCC 33089]